MKRFLRVALVGFATALPLAFAQDAEPFVGGGFSISFISGETLAALTFQGGADDLFGSAGLRGNFDIGMTGGFFEFGVDVLSNFPSDELIPYFGGGFGLLSGNGAYFQIHGTAGAEFFVGDQFALFGELQPKFFITSTEFGASLRFGANYHLD